MNKISDAIKCQKCPLIKMPAKCPWFFFYLQNELRGWGKICGKNCVPHKGADYYSYKICSYSNRFRPEFLGTNRKQLIAIIGKHWRIFQIQNIGFLEKTAMSTFSLRIEIFPMSH